MLTGLSVAPQDPAWPCGPTCVGIRKACVHILYPRLLGVRLQIKPDTLVLNLSLLFCEMVIAVLSLCSYESLQ